MSFTVHCSRITLGGKLTLSRQKRTKGPLTPVSDLLDSVLTGIQVPEDIELKDRAFASWDEAAGEAAPHSHPFRFKGSTLIVEVSQPAWINELSMRKTDILNRLERAVGERVVEDIRFEVKKKRPQD